MKENGMSKQNNMARSFCSNIKFKSLIFSQLHCTVLCLIKLLQTSIISSSNDTGLDIMNECVFLRHNVPCKYNSRKTCCEKEG